MNHGIVSRMKRSKRKSTVSFALVAGLLVLLLLPFLSNTLDIIFERISRYSKPF